MAAPIIFIVGKYDGSGDLSADLRTWLSAILANTDTCMEGFEGATSNNIKGHSHIYGEIRKVDLLVSDVLNQVQDIVTSDHFPTGGKFPSWVEVEPAIRPEASSDE